MKATIVIILCLLFSAKSSGQEFTFTNFTNINHVYDQIWVRDTLWQATTGGVVARDINGTIIDRFTTANGLPDNDCRALALDSAGHIWIGTTGGGAGKRTGHQWEQFDQSQGLASNYINDIVVDTSGGIYFATDGSGISYLKEGIWNTMNQNNGLPDNAVLTLAIDKYNHLWAGTFYEGVARHNGSRWDTIPPSDSTLPDATVFSITQDKQGDMWFGTWGGIARLTNNKWHQFTVADGLLNNWTTSLCAYQDTLWAGNVDGINAIYQDTVLLSIDSIDGSDIQQIKGLQNHPAGALLGGGIKHTIKRSSGWETYTDPSGPAHNEIYDLGLESSGTLWLATLRGATAKSGNQWEHHQEDDGLPSSDLAALAIDSSGNKWFGAGTGGFLKNGLSRFDGTNWQSWGTSDSLIYNQINVLSIDTLNQVWIGTIAGISVFNQGTFINYTRAEGLNGDIVNDIGFDSLGHTWVAGEGISVLNESGWQNISENDGLISNHVNGLLVDEHQDKWFATDSGISRYDLVSWQSFTAEDGLPGNTVNDITRDARGRIWIATNSGIAVWDHNNWYTANQSKGLADNKSYKLLSSGTNIWVASPSGLSQVNYSGITNNVSVTQENNAIKAYPNPVKDILHIGFSHNEGKYHLSLFNNLGQLIMSKPLNQHSKNYKLRLPDLQTGMYYLIIKGDSVYYTKKMIVK